MFDNNYSVLAIYRSKPLLDSEKVILDAQFRRWPVGRCAESMALEAIAGMGMPLWKRRFNTATPPLETVRALSEQVPGATFALDFGTYASPWRGCVNYSAGKVVYWSAKANRECRTLGSDGDGAAAWTVDRDDKPASEVLRDIAKSFYVHACSNIHLGIVEGIGMDTKEQWDTESHFEAYEAIKELLPDEERAYLGEVERDRNAMLASAKVDDHVSDGSDTPCQSGAATEIASVSLDCSGDGDADWRREPFPPTPPLLVEHPYVRIIQFEGFCESDFDPAKRISVPLTQAEIRVLAQHHLDRIYQFAGYVKTGGSFGSSDTHRDYYHQGRFYQLAGQLPREDQEKFNQIIDIRARYIETLRDPEEDAG